MSTLGARSSGITGPARSTMLSRTTRSTGDLRALLDRLARVQGQLISMRRVERPSDDPIGIAKVMAVDEHLKMAESYQRNIDDARNRMSAADDALGSATTILGRIKELALQGAHGQLSAGDRTTIANEVGSLVTALMQTANSRYGNEFLFSGHRVFTAPYASLDTAAAYQGTTGAIIREVGPGVQVQVNVTALDAFESAKTAVATLVSDLQTNNSTALQNDLAALDAAFGTLVDQRSVLGARAARVEASEENLATTSATFEELRSSIVDLDVVKATTELRRTEVAAQAAFETTTRLMRMSIFDYLR